MRHGDDNETGVLSVDSCSYKVVGATDKPHLWCPATFTFQVTCLKVDVIAIVIVIVAGPHGVLCMQLGKWVPTRRANAVLANSQKHR